MDSTDTWQEKAERLPRGKIVRATAGRVSCSPFERGNPLLYRPDLLTQPGEGKLVCLSLCANERVAASHRRKKLDTNELAKPATQPVTIYRRMLVLGNDKTDAGCRLNGSGEANVEIRGLQLSSPSPQTLDIRFPSETFRARKTETARLLRTSSGAGRSNACDPSFCAGSILRVPTSLPCGCGIRVSGCGACCGDDM